MEGSTKTVIERANEPLQMLLATVISAGVLAAVAILSALLTL